MTEKEERTDRTRRAVLAVPAAMFLFVLVLAACGKDPYQAENSFPATVTAAVTEEPGEDGTVTVEAAVSEAPETAEDAVTEEAEETEVTVPPANTLTPTPESISPSVVTPEPEKKATPTPTAKALPNYTARATCTPKPYVEIAANVTYPSGTYGLTNERVAFRPSIGRQVEPYCYVPYKTKVQLLSCHISEWNEIWYKVKVTVNGTTQTGYIQGCAIDFGLTPTPTPKSIGMVKIPTSAAELTKTYGTDKDKDGNYVVVLDPGHGGDYCGAFHYGTKEQTINMKVAKYCKMYLEANYMNVKVYLTHVDEKTVFTARDADDDLEYRVQYAVDRNADLLVSLHFDATSGSASGGEVLISKKSNVYAKSVTFANYVLNEFAKIGRPTRGIYKRTSARSKYTDGTYMDTYLINRLAAERGMIGVIIEHCYMDCAADRQYWDSDSDLEAYGEADARAIAKFLGLYKIGQVPPTPTATPSPKATATAKPTATVTVKAAATPTTAATPTVTVMTPMVTPTVTVLPTATPTPEEEQNPTPSVTEAPEPTEEAEITLTPAVTPEENE